MSYKCEHFKIHELVPPQVFKDRGEKAWELMDVKLLRTIDALREEFGSATINNYEWGGDREWSGLRTSDSPWFSAYSQHTFGRAADLIFKEVAAHEVRALIKQISGVSFQGCDYIKEFDNKRIIAAHIHGLEEGISWVHIDVRNYDGLKIFTP